MYIYILAMLITLIFMLFAMEYKRVYKKMYKLNKYNEKEDTLYCQSKKHTLMLKKLKATKRKFYIFATLSAIPLFVVGAIRYDVGTDYMYTYYPNFIKILNGENAYTEIGFVYLNKFIQLFTHNATWLFVITSALFVGVLFKCIYDYSKNPIISLAVVFFACIYFFSLNNVRQAISAVIMLASYKHIRKNNFTEFLIYDLIACIFHYSSLLLIPVYIFINWKFVKKHFLSIAIVLTVGLGFIAKILLIIISNTKYSYFIESSFNNGQTTTINIIYGFFVLVIAFVVLYKDRKKDKSAWVLLCMQFFYFLVSYLSIFIPISEMISRIAFFFLIYNVLLIPYLCYKIKINTNRYCLLLTYFGVYFMYFYYYIVMKGYYQVLPYKTIFFNIG